MRRIFQYAFILAGLVVTPLSAGAADLESALELYQSENYVEAAPAFFEVMRRDPNSDRRDQAEIYLADSLAKLKFYGAAYAYYQDIYKAGRTNRYYLNAAEGLLDLQTDLHDRIFVPNLFNEKLDTKGLAQLDQDRIAQVNYMLGELHYRRNKLRDAAAFLEYVPTDSNLSPKAKYLEGLIQVRKNRPKKPREIFEGVISSVPADSDFREKLRVRNASLLALGRLMYGVANYDASSHYYGEIPRGSQFWFQSMYENAWSYYKQENYGRALGELHSITAPYFARHHMPEAYVIQGTAYFVACQWDRVRRSVDMFKTTYFPMLEGFSRYMKERKKPDAYFLDVIHGGTDLLAGELASEVRRSQTFRDYYYHFKHLEWELAEIATNDMWRGTKFGDDLTAWVQSELDDLKQVVGVWTKRQLRFRLKNLKAFKGQIDILDFEVTDAEATWLEQGREILKGRRARLPRPAIPNDQWQHWRFNKEYWKGELGYFQHTIRSECD